MRPWVATLGAGCIFFEPPPSTPTTISTALPVDSLWALVHPTEAPPEGPGIVHVASDGAELARLPLPPGVDSPHGLAYDGTSLWLSDYGDSSSILELDPADGAVRSVIAGVRTEGIGLDGDGMWVDSGDLVRIDRTGVETDRRPGGATVQDVAYDGTDVLYLTNGSTDTVTRVAADGTRTELPDPVTRNNMGYAMTVWQDTLLVVDATLDDEALPANTTVLRSVDPFTGARVDTYALPVAGWITAIAPGDRVGGDTGAP